jgi:hypothetical protein
VIGGAALALARGRNWLYLDITSRRMAAAPVLRRRWLVFRKAGIRFCDRNTGY